MKLITPAQKIGFLATMWALCTFDKNHVLRTDTDAVDVMEWTVLIIGVVILFIIIAALMPTFLDSLTDYDNASTDPIATVIPTLGPILLSVALLLLLVFTLLRRAQQAT